VLLAQIFSCLFWVRDYAPETPLFPFTGAYLSFLFKKTSCFINRDIFWLIMLFYDFFESIARTCNALNLTIFFFNLKITGHLLDKGGNHASTQT
jgi:hypothetical protein